MLKTGGVYMRYTNTNRRPPCMRNNFQNSPVMPNNMPYYGMPYYGGPHRGNCPKGTVPYTVKTGDTLYSIAIENSTSIDAIMSLNPSVTDPNVIYAGQLLCLSYLQTCDGFLYTIKLGDTLYSIALSFSITLEELLAANPQINPNFYLPGEILCIPQAYPCPGVSQVYVIKPSDTLTTILENCNVSLAALLAANPGFDPNNIAAGSSLCVVPTPCEPLCEESDRKIIPPDCKNIEELAVFLGTTTDAILITNPAYPPCYFVPGHPYCPPPCTTSTNDMQR